MKRCGSKAPMICPSRVCTGALLPEKRDSTDLRFVSCEVHGGGTSVDEPQPRGSSGRSQALQEVEATGAKSTGGGNMGRTMSGGRWQPDRRASQLMRPARQVCSP